MAEVNVEANFLTLYRDAVGRTEVPPQFHTWTALSLISSALENRVWVERMAYQRIYPNQYVFLIGDPASGKGNAINLGLRILYQMDRQGYSLDVYRGALTRAALQDELAERWKGATEKYEADTKAGQLATEPEGVSLYFVAPELSSGMSIGPQAKDLIKFLTDVWEGDVGRYRERTRTHGTHEFQNPCVNCIVGSAPEWCREVVDSKDLASGFWARVACVQGERDMRPEARIARPTTDRWTAYLPILAWRLSLLTKKIIASDIEFTGPMRLSPEADAIDIDWYMTRPAPEDKLFQAHWMRQPDQILRIATLLRFCDFWDLEQRPGEDWRTIGVQHWEEARRMSDQLLLNAGSFLGDALSHTHNWQVARVEEIIKRRQRIIQRPDLLRIVSRYGIKAKELERSCQSLEDEQKIQRWSHSSGNFTIEWCGERSQHT